MSNTGCRVKPEAVREIAFGALTTAFQPLGAAVNGFLRYIFLDNGTDTDMYLSLDGFTDHFRVRPGQAQVFDLKTNDILILPDQIISIRSRSLPSTGDAFVQTGAS